MISGRLIDYVNRNKGAFSSVGMLAAVALIVSFVYSPRVVGAAATQRILPVYSVERPGKYVSLTFDAAWADASVRNG